MFSAVLSIYLIVLATIASSTGPLES